MNSNRPNNEKSADKTEIDSLTIDKNDSSTISETFALALESKEQIDEEEMQEKTTQSPKRRSQHDKQFLVHKFWDY